jgi:hypothetical protein
VRSRGALPFFTRFYVAFAYPAARSACPKPARRGERRANAHCSRKLSEFGAWPRDDDDLAFDSLHKVLGGQNLQVRYCHLARHD